LNSVTRKDAYPLHRITSCLDAMASAQSFSMFDLCSAYHLSWLNQRIVIKRRLSVLVVRTTFGQCHSDFAMLVLHFSVLWTLLFPGCSFRSVLCIYYLDDIIVFSETTNQNMKRLIKILKRLHLAGLKYQKSVSFLGHVVSEKGIATDPCSCRMDGSRIFARTACLLGIRKVLQAL